ncbi:Homo sapiens C21orf47, unspliced partial mRNA, partial [Pan troglodytes]
ICIEILLGLCHWEFMDKQYIAMSCSTGLCILARETAIDGKAHVVLQQQMC